MKKASQLEVFEYSSDISLLHGAILSAQKQFSSNEGNTEELWLTTKEAYSQTVNIITETVKLISNGIGFKEWTSDDSNRVNRRMHAVLLYSVLKSSGLAGDDMDYIYKSVDGIFPKFGWDIYLELVKSCSWNVYYIEFVGALPEKQSIHVVWSTLQHCGIATTCDDCYLLHCVLQVAVRKVYECSLYKQSISPLNSHSDGKVSEELIEKNILSEESEQMDLYSSPIQLLHHIQEVLSGNSEEKSPYSVLHHALEFLMYYWKLYITPSTDEHNSAIGYNAVKSLLHCLLTACDLILGEFFIDACDLKPVYLARYQREDYPNNFKTGIKTDIQLPVSKINLDSEILIFIQTFSYLIVSADEILNQSSSLVEKTINNSVSPDFSRLKYNAFDIEADFSYLVFLNSSAVKKLLQHCCTQLHLPHETNSLVIRKLKEVNVTLQSLHPLARSSDLNVQEDMIKNFIFIIDERIKGHQDAIDCILQDVNLLNEESVLSCLERNSSILCQTNFAKLLLVSAVENELQYKTRLLQILFSTCKTLPLSDQQEILSMLLNQYGLTVSLKLPDFTSNVTALLNQTVKITEAGHQVVSLFMQSPQETMERIVSKAVDNSGQINLLVQMLHLVDSACKYQPTSDSPQLLISTLKEHITENLSATQLQNVVMLLQQLLQADNMSEPVLRLEELLLWCILPHLKTTSPPLITKSILQVFQDVCEKTLQLPNLNSWLKVVNMAAVFLCLYQLLNQCLIECSGHHKGMVVSVLDSLLEIQRQQGIPLINKKEATWLCVHLEKMKLQVKCYATDIIPEVASWIENPENGIPLHVLLTYTCRKMDEYTFFIIKQHLNKYSSARYPYLVASLAQVLSHCTLEEWKKLFSVVELCLEDCKDMVHLLQLENINTTGQLVLVTHTVVDALIVLNKWTAVDQDWPFIFSSLTISLKGSQEEHSLEALIQLFAELCRLEHALKTCHTSQLSVLLLDMASTYKSKIQCQSEAQCDIEIMKKYLFSILQTLKDPDVKCHVLAKLEE